MYILSVPSRFGPKAIKLNLLVTMYMCEDRLRIEYSDKFQVRVSCGQQRLSWLTL